MNLNLSASGSLTPQLQAAYLQTLPAIRERCTRVFELAKLGQLEHFDYHPENEAQVVDYCASIIQRDFGSNYASIPPHSRWQHFESPGVPRVAPLVASWSSSGTDQLETARRLIDLCLVSVLLDAGAGNNWVYKEEGGTGVEIGRSEGLAIASLRAFEKGVFSSVEGQPYRADAEGLGAITLKHTTEMFQVDETSNPMTGLEGRTTLLVSLAAALKQNPEFFGADGRPGNMIDYLLKESKSTPEGGRKIHISSLFNVLIHGLTPIWPARASLAGIPLGDVWPCNALTREQQPTTTAPGSGTGGVSSPPPAGIKFNPGSSAVATASVQEEGGTLVPFHKLTQWLAYSLVVPLQTTLGWVVEGMEDMTGLPEYRNGGLFVDLAVLTLRPETVASYYPDSASTTEGIPRLPPSHPAIIEWRAMTVILLDRTAAALRDRLSAPGLTLPQVLESATWKGGREIAKERRPSSSGPPIEIVSDGTVF